MTYVDYEGKPVQAMQLCWKNWDERLIDLLGLRSINHEDYVGNMVDRYSDDCGEEGPYIELTVPREYDIVTISHGDYVMRVGNEMVVLKPEVFERQFCTQEQYDEDRLADRLESGENAGWAH